MSAVSLDEIAGLMAPAGLVLQDSGFVDMPPFPPGLTLSQTKRQQVKQSRWQGPALSTLHLFAEPKPSSPACPAAICPYRLRGWLRWSHLTCRAGDSRQSRRAVAGGTEV
jgi:hypothetical protein